MGKGYYENTSRIYEANKFQKTHSYEIIIFR